MHGFYGNATAGIPRGTVAGSYGNATVQAYLDAQGYSNVDSDNANCWNAGTSTLRFRW